MERYDGKTKKDDYIKYVLIAAGIVVLIIGYKLITRAIYKTAHPTPDMTVIVACENAVDFDAEDSLEAALSEHIPDLDGNGKTVVDVKALKLAENEAIVHYELDMAGAKSDLDLLEEYLTEGTYMLFLLENAAEGQPIFDDYVGMQSAVYEYCNKFYCSPLPEDLSADNQYCVNITGCKLFEDIGWERVPFYGCIQKDASDEEYEIAVNMLHMIKDSQ